MNEAKVLAGAAAAVALALSAAYLTNADGGAGVAVAEGVPGGTPSMERSRRDSPAPRSGSPVDMGALAFESDVTLNFLPLPEQWSATPATVNINGTEWEAPYNISWWGDESMGYSEGWYCTDMEAGSGPYYLSGERDAETLDAWFDGNHVVWTRTPLPGYILGTQSNKVVAATNTATTAAAGLMSAADKTKLDAAITSYTETDPTIGLTNETLYVHGWHTNIVTRQDNGAVTIGERHGDYTNIYTVGYSFISTTYTNRYWHGTNSFVVGKDSDAYGKYSMAQGRKCLVYGNYSYAAGNRAVAGALNYNILSGQPTGGIANRDYTYVWQGVSNVESNYYSHGDGTYNVNPAGGIGGFYIGETNLIDHIKNNAPAPDLSGLTYVSNKVAEIEEALDEILGGSEGESGAPAYGDKDIAMFIVDVNLRWDASTNQVFSCFELKASTNNFLGANDSIKLQFFSQSDCADTGLEGVDRMKLYMTTPDSDKDFRSYTKIQNTSNYSAPQLVKLVVLVDANCLVRHPENNGAWLNEDNEELIWCYCRGSSGDYEKVAGTDSTLWQPIAPVRWFKNLPNWAK